MYITIHVHVCITVAGLHFQHQGSIDRTSTNMADFTCITEFYVGKHVFITGGTGFIGKVLVEKLLRSCPGIGGVYCLIRSKKGKSIEERMDAILTQPVGLLFCPI